METISWLGMLILSPWQRRLVMNVYVDDFKIAGDKANIDDAIKRLRVHMKLDEAVPINSGPGTHAT